MPGTRINIAATADAIIIAKRKADANVAITANVIASNAKKDANITVIANVNKTARNIKEYIPSYQ